MKYIRLGVVFLLITGMFLTCLFPAFSASNTDINKKADTLNKLSILKGYSGSYNLDVKMRRCDAVAFIVRFLGKEASVTSGNSPYKNTKFSDVKAKDWYAPYIGYCVEEGLIGGYLDGKFGPEDAIGEKTFLRMLLCALGYVYDEDFSSANIYQSAYNLGIVEDAAYKTKTADNKQYKRRDAYNALYNALTKENKKHKTKHIYVLIKEGAVTKAQALATGIIKDSIQGTVQLVTPIDEGKVSVKFNEAVKIPSISNVSVYETANPAVKLSVQMDSLSGDEIIIKTGAQVPDKAYTVDFAQIADLEGNTYDKLSGTFIGYRNPEVKSDFFKISKVEVSGRNELNLYFTHPVNVNSEIPSNYEIYENGSLFIKGSIHTLTVKLMSQSKNGVTLYLKDKTFTEGAAYSLKVSGDLSSAFGVKLNEANGDNIPFKGKAAASEDLKLLNISVLSNKVVELSFNKDINPTLAQQVFNYYITDSNGNPVVISKAVSAGEDAKKGKCVRITISGIFDKTKNYGLMINNLNDVTRQYYITEQKYSFSGYYPDKTDLVIVNASSVDAGTLAVYFDRPLDPASAAIASNFMVTGVTHTGFLAFPVKTYYNPEENPYLVKLYLPADKLLDGTRTYMLKVMTTLQDYLGNYSSKTVEYGFNNSGAATAKPTISDAVIISKDTIKVSLNKEIALDAPNILPMNYTLEYPDSGVTLVRIPNSVIYYDATTLILKFDALDLSLKYKLKFSSLKDYSGANIRNASDGQNSIDVRVGK